MLKYKIPQIVTLTHVTLTVASILGLTLGLTEPSKPARLRHKKRELLWCNSLILW